MTQKTLLSIAKEQKRYAQSALERLRGPVAARTTGPIPAERLFDFTLACKTDVLANIISEERLPINLRSGQNVNSDWLNGRNDCRKAIMSDLQLIAASLRHDAGIELAPSPKELTVKLTYFKQSGKYYCDGEFMVEEGTGLLDVWSHVVGLRNEGRLPGLVEGAGKEFNILVNVPGHPHEHPRLIMFNAEN